MPDGKPDMWRKKAGRLLRVFAPFTILFVGLAILNFRIEDANSSPRLPVKEAIEAADQGTKVPAGTPITVNIRQTPVATAIANAVERSPVSLEPTPTSKATLLPSEVATLTGPPSESQFSLSSPLAFYWYSTRELAEDQAFALVIIGGENEEIVGLVSEPNLGSGYQVHIVPENFGFSTGEYYWQVRLLQREGDVLIDGSHQRLINFVEAKS
jgi:hypothetical protein